MKAENRPEPYRRSELTNLVFYFVWGDPRYKTRCTLGASWPSRPSPQPSNPLELFRPSHLTSPLPAVDSHSMSLLAIPIPPNAPLDRLEAYHGNATINCPRCRLAVPRNVSLAVHEVSCQSSRTSTTLAVSLPKDGRPMRIRSNDNSSRSSNNNAAAGGSNAVARTSASPSSRDDSRLSDGETTSVSRNSPGHSIAYSEGSESSNG